DTLRYGKGRFDPGLVRNQLLLAPETAVAGDGRRLAGPGRAVPLSEVATVTAVRTPDVRTRENQQPAVFITAELDESEAGLGSAAKDVRGWMGEMKGDLPAGYRWELGGHYVRQQEAFHSLAVVMLVAVVLV